MTDHTPEPWAFYNGHPRQSQRDAFAKVCVVDKDDPTCVAYGKTLEDARANAARIVACVNACAGIPTGQLGDVARLVRAAEGLLKAQEEEARWDRENTLLDTPPPPSSAELELNEALAPFRETET